MKKALLTAIMAIYLLVPGTVAAHATPIEYSPESGDSLEQTPVEIKIKFSERVESRASSISVLGPNGNEIQTDKARVTREDPRMLFVPIASAKNGSYTVSWQVVSADDGHFSKGAYSFAVGAQTSPNSTPAQFQISHVSPFQEASSIFLELVGQTLLLGAVAILWIF